MQQRVCPACFDLFVPVEAGQETCAACLKGRADHSTELAANRRFWLRNPTATHLAEFAARGWDRLLGEARANFRRRASRRRS